MDTYNEKYLDRFIKIIRETFQLEDTDQLIDIKSKIDIQNIPINSITFVRLIVKLEEEFNITIIEDNLDFQRYETLEEIFFMVTKIIS